jgi:hypothetical protein
MEPEGSLPQSQVPATCPYPEPARSSQGIHKLSKNLEAISKVYDARQMTSQVSYWSPTNTERLSAKFICPDDLQPGICAPLGYYSVICVEGLRSNMKILGHVTRPTDQDFNPRPTAYIAQAVRYLQFTFTFLYFSSRCKKHVRRWGLYDDKSPGYICIPTASTTVLSTIYSYIYFIATMFVLIISHLRIYASFIHNPL